MPESARDAAIIEYCKQLRTPTLAKEHRALARQAANEGWPYEDYLHHLLEAEVTARQESVSARRVREAKFSDLKTLDQIEWEAVKGVPKQKIVELATCEYIDRGDDVVIAGPIGTGKTHLAIAIAAPASATAPAAASSTSSTWSTASSARASTATPAGWPTSSPGSISSCSTSWATCPSPRAAASSCST